MLLKSVYRSLLEKLYVRFPDGRVVYTDEKYSPRQIALAIKRVNAGMEHLDERVPDWEDKINLDQLKMSDGSFCIVGQTLGGYGRTKVAFVQSLIDSTEQWDELNKLAYDSDNRTRFPKLAEAARAELTRVANEAEEAETNLGFMEDGKCNFGLLDVIWVSALRRRAQTGRKVFLTLPKA